MPKKKLKKYAAVKLLDNIIETQTTNFETHTVDLKFDPDRFEAKGDITLEIGCGKGDYTLNLARKHRDRNFIGVDIKGDRLFHGATVAKEEGLSNVLFIRIRIESLAHFFPENTISEAWIPFPDPYVHKERKRLTSPRFLDGGGWVGK